MDFQILLCPIFCGFVQAGPFSGRISLSVTASFLSLLVPVMTKVLVSQKCY
jgi:hypothetical protein